MRTCMYLCKWFRSFIWLCSAFICINNSIFAFSAWLFICVIFNHYIEIIDTYFQLCVELNWGVCSSALIRIRRLAESWNVCVQGDWPMEVKRGSRKMFPSENSRIKRKNNNNKKTQKTKKQKNKTKKKPKPKPPQHNWWGNLQCCHMIVQNHLSQNSFLFFPSGSSFYSSLVEDLAKEEETE